MDEVDEKLNELARAYHEPPTPPREAMWARIEARRPVTGDRPSRVLPLERRAPSVRRVATWAAGIAAALLVGVAIGRLGSPAAVPGDVASSTPAPSGGPRQSGTALEVAALAHLRQAETYLTLFRASVRTGDTDDLAVSTARELLASNRFLSSAPDTDPRMRALLLDLELVLVGISQLQASARPEDIQLITDDLDHAGMLTRLRTASPRDSRPLPTGVL